MFVILGGDLDFTPRVRASALAGRICSVLPKCTFFVEVFVRSSSLFDGDFLAWQTRVLHETCWTALVGLALFFFPFCGRGFASFVLFFFTSRLDQRPRSYTCWSVLLMCMRVMVPFICFLQLLLNCFYSVRI